MVRNRAVLAVTVLLLVNLVCSSRSPADILFEGYSKVASGGVHVGYIITRYEFDAKKKQFSFTYLLKTNELAGNVLESIKAFCKEDLTPISYSYTTLVGAQPKTIDAKFEGGKIIATIKEGAKISKVNKALPKGVFLSYFLVYEMLRNPKGITPNTKYDYQAIAEEDASVVKGMAYVKDLEEFNGIKAYKILNDFKETKFISYVSEKGEVLASKSPVQSITIELMPQSSLATGNFQIPSSMIRTLFNDIPLGIKNEVAKKYQDNPKSFQSMMANATDSKSAPAAKAAVTPPVNGTSTKAAPPADAPPAGN